jgi:hypothetical protein
MKRSISLLVVLTAACGTGMDGEPTPVGSVGGGPSPGDAGAPSASPCAAPEGPLHDYTTAAELEALVLGKWLQCSGPRPPTLDGSRGVEFAADGRYFVLVDDGRGGLARGGGFTSEGRWDTSQATGTVVFLWFHPTPSSQFGDTPLFEDGPRRFAINPSHAGDLSIYVWIGP